MSEKEFTYIDSFGDKNIVFPVFNMYADNDNLYVGLEEYDEDLGIRDSYCDVTVNIVELPYMHSTINVSYGGQEKINFLIENGFGELTGHQIGSGYCMYPVFRFNEEKIKELNPEFFRKYAKTHGHQVDLYTELSKQINNAEKQGAEPINDNMDHSKKEMDINR